MKKFPTYQLPKPQLESLMASATSSGRRDGLEICGLIVAKAHHLILRQLRNKVKRGGSFAFYVNEVRSAVAQAETEGAEVIGTFHSHPVGLALPGAADIKNAVDDSLMLILECVNRSARLWRIRAKNARPLKLIVCDMRGQKVHITANQTQKSKRE